MSPIRDIDVRGWQPETKSAEHSIRYQLRLAHTIPIGCLCIACQLIRGRDCGEWYPFQTEGKSMNHFSVCN